MPALPRCPRLDPDDDATDAADTADGPSGGRSPPRGNWLRLVEFVVVEEVEDKVVRGPVSCQGNADIVVGIFVTGEPENMAI